MRVNTPIRTPVVRTHEGAPAVRISPEFELQRSVMANLLWEDTFYESGENIATRIKALIPKCDPEFVAGLAVTARTDMKLRHLPLLLVREMARIPTHKHLVARTLEAVIQRPDELTEFLAIYWSEKRQPLSAQVKKGLAKAFTKFNEYSLAKYDGDGKVKLRDVLHLSHSKPTDATIKFTRVERKSKQEYALAKHEELYKRVVERTLQVPDTWEVNLSAGADKKETFQRMMLEKKLGALAFLRNLRNMKEAGVDKSLMEAYMDEVNMERVLPFRFIAAARAVPEYESMVERGMLRCLAEFEKMPGTTVLVVDNSGSMYNAKVSEKSEIDRSDAACALAVLLREVCEDVKVIAFSSQATIVPDRRGFALVDAIKRATDRASTMTDYALELAERKPYDRIIVVTDEQSHQTVRAPKSALAYFINVSVHRNGVGYGRWVHIDGWSEAILNYIQKYEQSLTKQ